MNYVPHQSQCYVRLPLTDLGSGRWRFEDQIGNFIYDRAGDDLKSQALYLDLPAWRPHIFSMARLS